MNVFSSGSPYAACEHCGLVHTTPCPRIRAVEYYPDGSVKRIEYHAAPEPALVPDDPFRTSWENPPVNLTSFRGLRR